MRSFLVGTPLHAHKLAAIALALVGTNAFAAEELSPQAQKMQVAIAYAPEEADKQIAAATAIQTKGDLDSACKTWMAARNAINITIQQQQIASQNGFTWPDDADTKAKQTTALEKFNTVVLPGMQASCFVPEVWAYQKQLSGPNQYDVNQVILAGPAIPELGGHAKGGYRNFSEAAEAVKSVPGLKAIFYFRAANRPTGYVVHTATAYAVDKAAVANLRKTGKIDVTAVAVAHPTYTTAHLNDDGYEIVANVVPWTDSVVLEGLIGEDGTRLLGKGLRAEHYSASTGYLRKLFNSEAGFQRWPEAKLVYNRFVVGSAAAATSEPVVKTRIEMLGALAKSKQPEMITFIKAEIKKHKIPAKDAAVILAAK